MDAMLELSGKDLAGVARSLAKVTRKAPDVELLLTFRDGQLELESGGAIMGVAATGNWSGTARVDRGFGLRSLQQAPEADPIRISIRDGRLMVGNIELTCRWSPRQAPQIQLALNDREPDLLRVARSISNQDIEAAGLQRAVEQAEAWLNERLDRVTKLLAPLGVERAEIVQLVEGKLVPASTPSIDSMRTLQQDLGLALDGDQLELAEDA